MLTTTYPLIKNTEITHGFNNDNEFLEYLNNLLFSNTTQTPVKKVLKWWFW